MLTVLIFALLLISAVVSLIALFINGIRLAVQYIRKADKKSAIGRIRKNMGFFIIICVLGAGFIWITQVTVSTPPILDENGKKIERSIAELRKVSLNGRKEWISIRGYEKENPVLLFLAGGPGGTQMAAVRHELSELEKYFVVVNWDQAGSGKSYGAAATKDLSVDTYVEDGDALTKYLCNEFQKEKIYLVGESWGSTLGIFMADKSPELYHAFIGTGQMISFLDTEIMNYKQALAIAKEQNDTKMVAKLEKNGPPPYYGDGVTMNIMTYNSYLGNYMAANPAIQNSGYNTFRDIFSAEYGILDKINFLYGLYTTFGDFYPKLYPVDLRKDYVKLDIPVYFFLGRYDINAPTALVEDYYDVLNAPKKEIVWFEHSGHSPWINERKLFAEKVLQVADIE